MQTDLSSFTNSWYIPGSKFKVYLWYFFNVIFFMNPLNPISSLKVWILKLFGAQIGSNVLIKQNVNIKYPWLLEIGDNVWIGENVWIDNLAKVTLKNNVCISQGAMLLCGNHDYKKTTFDLMIGEIRLEDGVWIGARATVCPNVRVFSHAILTVGSVATKDIESYSIYQGNPATKIRQRIIYQ